MARYRPVYVKFWKDPIVQEYEPLKKLVFLYMITNESIPESGVYQLSIRTVSLETGVPFETVLQMFEKGFENVTYDSVKNIIFVHNFKRYNPGGRTDLVEKGIIRDMAAYRSENIWEKFLEEYPVYTKTYSKVLKRLKKGLENDVKPILRSTSTNRSTDRKKKYKGKLKKWDAENWEFELSVIERYSKVLPHCSQLTDPLKTNIGHKTFVAIRARSKERIWTDGEPWQKLFDRCSQSEWLTQGAWFNLPWIVNPMNMEKIEMGSYDNKQARYSDDEPPTYEHPMIDFDEEKADE